jgi:dipeptidyl aminopeptidase/acylaminoacyl peptidase
MPRISKISGRCALAAAAAVVLAAHADAQSTAAFVPEPVRDQEFQLSIRDIMRGPELVGDAPAQVRWTDDSAWIYFRWKPGGEAWDAEPSLYRVPARGGEPERLDEAATREAGPLIAPGDLSPDRRWRISAVAGDLYLVDRRSMRVRRLTHTEDVESAPMFGPGGGSVLFRRGNDLYRITLSDGALEQLTRIEEGPAPAEKEAEGQRKFLEEQQLELFEHVRRQKAREEEQKARRDSTPAGGHHPVYLDRGERVRQLDPTRDGSRALVRTIQPAQNERNTIVPEWVTESGYTEDIQGRTNVGDAQSRGRVGLLDTETDTLRWLEVAPDGYQAEGAPRVENAGWNDAGTKAFLFVVSHDNKERWLWSIDAATGARTLLDHLHDDAWVDGPCFGDCVGFVPGTDRVWFVSEKSGFAQMYAVNADGTDERALTSGDWEVLGVTIPEDRSRFLLTTNEGSPFDEGAWWMELDGSDRRRVTEGEGRFEVTPSPDGRRMAIVHDVSNRPPELYVSEARRPMQMTRVTTSPTKVWSSFPWIQPEIVRFRAEDGTMVPARIYRPRDLGARANGAGVIFVHGAGYLHNVHHYWSDYYREYMFNHLLAASGYTVLDIDYRGSAGYGRDWRTAIYRWMGGKDLSDQVDGAHWLAENEGVDAKRIGLYGGSYGGFMTLMALFTAGDTFKSGAALRSVTDWAHYNHGYTSDILNLPQNDPEAYEKSSPIYFAENLRPDQHLLILHGMVDTNVHFSDDVRLVQRLIELGKENWEFQPYPVENHGFVEPTSWTDEYRRIFELFEETLREPGCTEGGGTCAPRHAGG